MLEYWKKKFIQLEKFMFNEKTKIMVDWNPFLYLLIIF